MSDMRFHGSLGNQPLVWAAMDGHFQAVSLLLARGAQITAENKEGATAIYWAAHNTHATIIWLLLNSGAKCRPKDKIGWGPLHQAAFIGNTEVTSITMKDVECYTSTHHAALKGHASMVNLLVERGADLEDQDNDRWTVLQHV